MKNPGFQQTMVRILAAALFVVARPGFAQPPETSSNKKATAKSRPQVIYHLPSSSSAATLHSQAKGPSPDAPNDNNNSPQTSRPNPNPTAPQVPPEVAHAPTPKVQKQQRVKPPKVQSVRAAKPPSMKAKGQGHGGPKKSHKK